MAAQRNSFAPHAIETPVAWVQSGKIALPEIRRPFVRDATKCPQSSGFPPSGVSGELPADRRARSVGAAQGRLQVVGQTYAYRRPAAGDCADGRPVRAKGRGLLRGRCNRIAYFVLAQSEIDIAIGGNPPERDFAELAGSCNSGARKYGGLADMVRMRATLHRSGVPGSLPDSDVPDYGQFPGQRRVRMARETRTNFGGF